MRLLLCSSSPFTEARAIFLKYQMQCHLLSYGFSLTLQDTVMKLTPRGTVDLVWSGFTVFPTLLLDFFFSYYATVTLAFFQFLECPKLFSLQSILTSCIHCLKLSFPLWAVSTLNVTFRPLTPQVQVRSFSWHALLFLHCIYNNLYLYTYLF